MNKEKFSYGKSVSAEVYEKGLQAHQYIPQADEAILDTVAELAKKSLAKLRVLDLACGPGRLTRIINQIPNTTVLGIDASPEFIEYAKNKDPQGQYEVIDFTTDQINNTFNCVIVQGVLHHIHNSNRQIWTKKIHQLMEVDSTLIVGDEFIPPYDDEQDRKVKSGIFYLHIIDEAMRGGFESLAFEESLNFIADTQSEKVYCGYYNDEVIQTIIYGAANMSALLRDREVPMMAIYEFTEKLITSTQLLSKIVYKTGANKQVDRGDKKISVDKLTGELSPLFYLKNKPRIMGPIENIGAMAVLTFNKNCKEK